MGKKKMFMKTLFGGGGPPVTIPLANIISEYKFEDNTLDTVGTNDGTATGITYASGLVGQTGVFTESPSYVSVTNSVNLQGYPISISLLVKTVDAGTGYRVIAMKRDEWNIYMKDNILMFYDWNTTSDKTTGTNIGDNSWHSVVETIDVSGVTKLYLDGVLVLTDSMTNLGNSLNLTIGSTNTFSQLFNGDIDCLRIWDKELSQIEITAIATDELAGVDINP